MQTTKLFKRFQHNKSTLTLYLGDCVRGMQEKLGERSVDAVVTSPPYNIGIDYNEHDDRLPRVDYLRWMGVVGTEIKRVLKENGSLFLNIGNTPKDQWIAWDVAQVLRRDFVLQNVIHWIKSIAIERGDVGENSGITTDVAVGHFKPIVSRRFLNDCHEYIFHFTKTGNVELRKLSVGVPYQDKSNIGRWKLATQDKRDRGNTWFIPYDTIQSRTERPHPATFPVKLPVMCLKLHGVKAGNSLVLDPFVGIGSTGVASLHLDASFVGFEIDPIYLEDASLRLSSEIFMVDRSSLPSSRSRSSSSGKSRRK